jgi:hypothetical protein
MLLASQEVQHVAGMLEVRGFAEDLAAALGDRVAADHDAAIDPLRHVAGLLKGQSGDELRRRFAAADAALGGLMRRNHGENIACFG